MTKTTSITQKSFHKQNSQLCKKLVATEVNLPTMVFLTSRFGGTNFQL